MKKITSIGFALAMVFMLGTVLTFNSCTKDKTDICANVTCTHGTLDTTTVSGTCSCNCDLGYYGSGCGTTFNSAFLGSATTTTWNITNEVSNGTVVNFSDPAVAITSGGTANTITMTNFEGLKAHSDGTGQFSATFTLSDSTGKITTSNDLTAYFSTGDTVTVVGYNGTMNAAQNVFTYSYTITYGSTTEHATGTLVKQ